MKTFRIIGFALLAILFCLSACSGGGDDPIEPTPQPEVIKSEITIDASILTNGLSFTSEKGEQSISFSTNESWTLSVASTTSGATWCTASATSGSKGTANVKFTVSENTDYDNRSVSVTIKSGTASKTFTVSQKYAEALLLTTDKYEVSQEGGTIDIEVKSNIEYQMEISENSKDWIKESSSRALTAYKHTLNIAANEEAEKREGEIYFKSGDKVETVKIYQAGGAVILLSQNEYQVSDRGDTISVDVQSNVEFGVQMPDVDWIIDESSSRGLSSHTLKYIVSANEEYDNRSTSIVFYDKNSDLKDTLKVVQAQKDAIIISEKNINVEDYGGTIEVKLNTNVDFEVQIPSDVTWVTQAYSRALTEKSIYLKILENTNKEVRSTEVVFINNTSLIKESITINQAGAFKESYENGIATIITAGSLKAILGDDYLNITSLKVIGPINGDDIKTIREMVGVDENENETSGILAKLDISEASIISGGSSYYHIGMNEYKTANNEIGARMFAKTNLKEIHLPKNVRKINSDTFNNCTKLTNIILPDSLVSIGGGALKNVENLESIVIPEMVDSIGGEAFAGCKKLKSINIPQSIKYIGQLAFEYCENLTEVYITDLVSWCNIHFASGTGDWEHICFAHPFAASEKGNLYLKKSLVTELVIPSEITEIKPFTFYNCSSFSGVKIPDHVVSVDRYAFRDCSGIDSLYIGNGIKYLDKNSFYNCGGVECLVIDNNLATIDFQIIPYHEKLKKLVLSEKVGQLNMSFFYAPLTEVFVYATTPPKINQYTFNKNKLSAKLYVPKGAISAYEDSYWGLVFFKEIIAME